MSELATTATPPEHVDLRLEAVLPQILNHLQAMQATKLRVTPTAAGGYEVEVLKANRLFVSRQELADMLPRFTESANPGRYVDKLVQKGMPYIDATGSRMFCVGKCVAWLEKWFEEGGKVPKSA